MSPVLQVPPADDNSSENDPPSGEDPSCVVAVLSVAPLRKVESYLLVELRPYCLRSAPPQKTQ